MSIFGSILGESMTLGVYLMIILFATICGIITAVAMSIKDYVNRSMLLSIVFLPAIVATVITMVNGNIGTGIAVAGAFSLIRFRSAQGKAKEITMIFLAMTAGITCAAGYVGIALLFTLIIGIAVVVYKFFPISIDSMYDLRITVPETLNVDKVFDEIIKKYTTKYELVSVKTTDMGNLYKLQYKIVFNSKYELKSLIDDLRCKNGNLEILVCKSAERDNEL